MKQILLLCFSDDVMTAMTDPAMVLPRQPTLEDLENGGKVERVPVAKLTCRMGDSNELLWKYVELPRNRIFESPINDPETAYQEFLLSLNREKMEKSEKFEEKKTKAETEMVFVMKCCLIAYLDSVQDSEMTKIDPEKIEPMLTENTDILYTIMAVYFKTGMALGVVVNNPAKIYQKCVTLHCNGIRQAVAGQRKLDVDENDAYIEAMTIIRDGL